MVFGCDSGAHPCMTRCMVTARSLVSLPLLCVCSYCPTLLWGWFGQLQTLAYGFVGRFQLKTVIKGDRHTVHMSDGTTMTYDVFEPEVFQGVTILLCPGITNHSECLYIQSLVIQAHTAGHRVAVLNHTGALNSVPLTAPRVFTYGKLVHGEECSHCAKMVGWLGFNISKLSQRISQKGSFLNQMFRQLCCCLLQWSREYSYVLVKITPYA